MKRFQPLCDQVTNSHNLLYTVWTLYWFTCLLMLTVYDIQYYQQKDRHSFQPQVGGRGPGRSLPTENILARAPQGPRRGRFREKDTFIVLRFATVAYVTLCVQCAELHWKESCQLKFGVGFGPHWHYDYCYWLIILFFFSLFFSFRYRLLLLAYHSFLLFSFFSVRYRCICDTMCKPPATG